MMTMLSGSEQQFAMMIAKQEWHCEINDTLSATCLCAKQLQNADTQDRREEEGGGGVG